MDGICELMFARTVKRIMIPISASPSQWIRGFSLHMVAEQTMTSNNFHPRKKPKPLVLSPDLSFLFSITKFVIHKLDFPDSLSQDGRSIWPSKQITETSLFLIFQNVFNLWLGSIYAEGRIPEELSITWYQNTGNIEYGERTIAWNIEYKWGTEICMQHNNSNDQASKSRAQANDRFQSILKQHSLNFANHCWHFAHCIVEWGIN